MMDRITVVVDTREQEPYSFDSDKVSPVRPAVPAPVTGAGIVCLASGRAPAVFKRRITVGEQTMRKWTALTTPVDPVDRFAHWVICWGALLMLLGACGRCDG